MQINFYPDYDNFEFKRAAGEYGKIWEEEGTKITDTIEKVSGLKFKEKIINAIIYSDISYSIPLRLQANTSIEHKKGTLTHELCHRLVAGNNISIKVEKNHTSRTMAIHKHIDLILYDIRVEIYGEDFAKEEADYEISLWTGREINPYKVAWDWALSMTKEERQKLWKESLGK